MKLPSFPRKALEAELDLHANGEIGKVSDQYNIPECFVIRNKHSKLTTDSWF